MDYYSRTWQGYRATSKHYISQILKHTVPMCQVRQAQRTLSVFWYRLQTAHGNTTGPAKTQLPFTQMSRRKQRILISAQLHRRLLQRRGCALPISNVRKDTFDLLLHGCKTATVFAGKAAKYCIPEQGLPSYALIPNPRSWRRGSLPRGEDCDWQIGNGWPAKQLTNTLPFFFHMHRRIVTSRHLLFQ